jgi:hypothetical protein
MYLLFDGIAAGGGIFSAAVGKAPSDDNYFNKCLFQ